jgi:1-acyl-sn-glycerol-3-phosphate acyltransferase
MKEWLYWFVKASLILPFRIFIRKIYFDNLEHFPTDKPVFLASNHPNSFLDGVIFEHFFNRRIYTLARGDAFLKPLPNYILRGLRLLPIFRARDARAEVARKGNKQTQDEILELFKKKHSVLIFCEGTAFPEKTLRPIKKGTANMAIALEKESDFQLDLQVVPVAINYSRFGTLRRDIHVSFQKGLAVSELKSKIEKDEKEAVQSITTYIKEALSKSVVQTKGEEQELRENVHHLLTNTNARNRGFVIKNKWETSVAKANKLAKEQLEEIAAYFTKLKELKVKDANVANTSADFISYFIAIVTLGISFPVYIVWMLIWQLVVFLVHKKITNPIFKDSVIVGGGMVLSIFFTIGVFAVFFNLFDGWFAWVSTLLALYGGVCWFRLISDLPVLWSELRYLSFKDQLRKDLEEERAKFISWVS